MKRNWSEPELESHWTISVEERKLIAKQKGAAHRLGLALLHLFLKLEGRFPRKHREIPATVIAYVGAQIAVHPTLFAKYSLSGRVAMAHRQAIRRSLGWRLASAKDGRRLTEWLRQKLRSNGVDPDHLQELVIDWFRDQHIEPPTDSRIGLFTRTAVRLHESALFTQVAGKISDSGRRSLDRLLETVAESDDAESNGVPISGSITLNSLKTDPGRPGLDSLFREIAKLGRIEDLGLPANLFSTVPTKTVEIFRRRAATEPPNELRQRIEPVRHTLTASFCWERRREIIDGLIDLLIQIVHRIGVNAEKKVEKELLSDFRKVRGKMTIFARMVNVAVAQPQGVIKDVIYPEVGEDTLKALVAEFKTSGSAYRNVVHTVMRASYSTHYRRMLPVILDALRFKSNNDSHRPVIDALALLRSQRDSRFQYFPEHMAVPIDGVVTTKWRDIVISQDEAGKDCINRINYEICVLQALREGLRSKEIWVEGANRFRNPDDDLPSDFSEKRDSYYALLNLSRKPEPFVNTLRKSMTSALSMLNSGMPKNNGVRILKQGRGGRHMSVAALERQTEPAALAALKREVAQRWPSTNLLDILKEVELRVQFTDAFQSTASIEKLERRKVQRRLLLCLYGLGTNAGLKRILNGDETETYKELLYMRRRYIQKTALRSAIAKIVNATLAVRSPEIWGEGTTACASDSKKFGAWDQNLMTEWHIRYGGRGVMIYWHVERKSLCIYSQLKRCSSSEVAAMIEGVLRHCTDMEVEKNYVDSHGQSEVAFAFSHLLGFELLPRLKAINKQVLYVPNSGDAKRYQNIEPILTRPINWDLIAQQYDEMVKYTTALKLGTAESESILRRFRRQSIQHPTYLALAELGKVIKTLFLCRYLHSLELRQEIHEGLNVIESWNNANSFIFYGKGGEVATNQLEDQELSVLCLHLLQLCLVYVNTLMFQRVLVETAWLKRMDKTDFRALTPLVFNHVNPYGRFELNMNTRLEIDR